MERALWIRNLSCFNLRLEWEGNKEVLVKGDDGKVIDRVETGTDPAAVGRTMKEVEEEMHEAAQGFC